MRKNIKTGTFYTKYTRAASITLAAGLIVSGLAGCGFSNIDSAAAQPGNTIVSSETSGVADNLTTGVTDLSDKTGASMTSGAVSSQAATSAANRTMGVCGLYIYDEASGARRFVDRTYASTWEKGRDIMCFEVFNTREASLPGKVFKYMWEPVWFTPDDAAKYRIGYAVDFTLKDGTKIHKMLIEPEDTLEYKKYMEFYMYDDYHQTPGVWYSHVEQSAYNSDTILTSIKFTAGQEYDKIDGKVTLTAFIYDPAAGQFDKAGNYTGSVYYSIDVVNR
mgnify:FL=1